MRAARTGTEGARCVQRWTMPATLLSLMILLTLTAATEVVTAQGQRRGRSRQELVARLTGKPVHVDRSTGAARPITEQEAAALVDRIAALTAAPERTTEVPLRQGGSMIALSGHGAGHVLISRPNANGSVAVRCVTSAEEAVDFLAGEIDDQQPVL
ncbi:MAG: hypothetical protein AB7N65_14835 [Vicinamibacterales bacterium]